MNGKTSILIDTDIAFGSPKADVDDVLAIMLARSVPRLEIAAITPVGGNVPAERASDNLHRFLARTGLAGIPHAWSTSLPLDPKLKVQSELWDRLPGEATEKPEDAPRIDSVDLILKTARESAEPLTIVAIGPLTNIGMALAREPGMAANIREIVMMGGSRKISGLHGLAEFNIWVDPFAAAIVFDSGIPVTMFGLDVTRKRKVLPEDIARWDIPDSPLVRDVHDSYLGFMRFKATLFGPSQYIGFFHDAFPIAYFHDPGLFRIESCEVKIGTDDADYGTTLIDLPDSPGPAAKHHHRFAVDVDEAALMEYVVGTIASFWKGAK
jgi:pyrimidine-specific ribonucleoside hydrolase